MGLIRRRNAAARLTAVAVGAGLLLTGALANTAVASVSSPPPIATITMSPTPIAASGSLKAGAAVTVTLTALDSTSHPIVNATVYIAFVPTSGGGRATVHTKTLNNIPIAYKTGLSGTIKITYHAPANPQPTSGDDWIGSTANPFNSNVTAADTYTFVPAPAVSAYHASPSPIAATGTLAAASRVPVTVTAVNSGGTAVPYADVYVSFTPATGGGTAYAHGIALTSTPQLFKASSTGTLGLSYHAPGVPPTTGTDTVTIANAASGATVTVKDSYTF